MTSSLVGSEMCIRDSPIAVLRAPPLPRPARERPGFVLLAAPLRAVAPVSYTHLTLPTICSV
eukprot:1697876-Prorocentrum_lima.AAC.1